MDDFPKDLLGVLAFLERGGWDYKFLSRTIDDGTRRYVASVWRQDELGGGRKCCADTPQSALLAALLDARKRRRRLARSRSKRNAHALLVNGQVG